MKESGKKKEFIIATVLFAGYLLFNGILLAGHELWRDEANVWLFARDASPIQLLREIKYQGHPCLWYFIVMPFAKLGFPFFTISVLSFLVMALAAGIFTYRSPFHSVTKAICLFSPMFSYYYSVVARNYCLIALLLILLAYCYPKRNERPILYGLLLGLLVQSDTIALAAAGVISLMWLWECVHKSLKEKRWQPVFNGAKGLWIPLFSLILWVAQFYQVSDSPEYQMRVLGLGEMLREIRNFSYYILSRMTGQGELFDLGLILAFLATAVLLSIKMKNFWPMAVMVSAFLLEVVFSILVYQLHIWHYIALCFTLIWFFWLGCRSRDAEEESGSERNRRLLKCGRALSEGVLIFLGITMFMRWNAPEESSSLLNAINGLYSDGVNAAEYIERNISTEELLLSTDVSEASTIQAYLGQEYGFYYAGSGQIETYAKYNEEQSGSISYEDMILWVKEKMPEKDSFYLIESSTSCISDIPDEEKEKWEICYQTVGDSARGENYCIYRIPLSQ